MAPLARQLQEGLFIYLFVMPKEPRQIQQCQFATNISKKSIAQHIMVNETYTSTKQGHY
jgi:hypothetical protein